MPRASAAAAAATARHIREIATEMFGTRGFGDVSLDDVAESAGVTRGAVYHHYRSKAGLFGAVAADLQAAVATSVVEAAESAGDDPRAQLRAGCHGFLDAITAEPAVRILLVDGPAVFGWDKWRQMDAENSVVHLREALASVGTDPDLLDPLTAQLSGAMNEAALWLAQSSNPDAPDRAHRALDLLVDTVLG
ncbi:TetR/AcrR family transcriptional regulator [Gordonia westfalica]|uniref:TetR/AcrR family transcriptional regulator n=1 Tax=Gordonia westfalica TaxID=158898 RepID=A0ABU2GZE3_9ACTN|nr:TetR/AcrR family transcriptional regulator [Gordonia westfalica]MDS1116829.1 TetR/AcrR family transcriptional regulator [Gordonia westfalica]